MGQTSYIVQLKTIGSHCSYSKRDENSLKESTTSEVSEKRERVESKVKMEWLVKGRGTKNLGMASGGHFKNTKETETAVQSYSIRMFFNMGVVQYKD